MLEREMVGRVRFLEHHVERVKYWDRDGMTPEEVARDFIRDFNNPIAAKRDWFYPETPEFIKAIARLVEAHRNGEEIEILDDFHSDKYLDPMCRACGHCGNPIRDFQIRLPGFEDI